jgi:tetratricopeptide (TPR) repeat protein
MASFFRRTQSEIEVFCHRSHRSYFPIFLAAGSFDMNIRLLALSLALAPIFVGAAALAQNVQTQAPCSPVVDHTQGNVTVTFSGGCTSGITPVELKEIIDSVLAQRAIPPELLDRYEIVSRQFGVTDTALGTFFRILGEKKVATDDLDAKLREVAARHLTLLKQAEPTGDDDPQVAAIKKEAVAAIADGNYAGAEELLLRAFDTDLAAARRAQEAVRRAQDAADKRYLTAAKTRADLGELKLTELRYAAAGEDFQAAADLVPQGEQLVRSGYLNSLGRAARSAGNYPLASTALAEALSIRERLLDPEHPDTATSLNELALLYKTQGHLAETEPLYKRALAIDEKVLGPEHPTVAINLNNLASRSGPPCRGGAALQTRPRDRREGARAGASECRHPPQQPRRAVSRSGPPCRGGAALQTCPRDRREGARAGASGRFRGPQQPRPAV